MTPRVAAPPRRQRLTAQQPPSEDRDVKDPGIGAPRTLTAAAEGDSWGAGAGGGDDLL